MIKKILQKLFKIISYGIFFKIYGKIEKSIDVNADERIKVKIVNTEKDLSYKVYNIMENIHIIIGYGKIIWIKSKMAGLVFVNIENFGV